MFSGLTVSSSLTFLNGAIMSLSHRLSRGRFNVCGLDYFFQRHGSEVNSMFGYKVDILFTNFRVSADTSFLG